jgi:hypothetical protein
MFLGEAIHEYIQKYFSDKELEINTTIGGINVKGRIDLLHNDTIYEFKFTNSLEPKSYQLWQAKIYAYMTGKKVKLVLINHDFDFVEYDIKLENDDYAKILELVNRAYKYINNLALAYWNSPVEKWACKYCPLTNCDRRVWIDEKQG